MKTKDEKTELEKKLEKAREGFGSLPAGFPPFAFAERSLGREEVTTRFQEGLSLFAEVRRTRAEYELAMEKQRQALPALKQFHGEAMQIARKHFGADAKAMSTFGVKCPERGGRRRRGCRGEHRGEVISEVGEEVIVEEVVNRGEGPASKRGCRPVKRPVRPVKRGCEEAKGCAGRGAKRGR